MTLEETSDYGTTGRTGFGMLKKKNPAEVDMVNPEGQSYCTMQGHSVLYQGDTSRKQANMLPK